MKGKASVLRLICCAFVSPFLMQRPCWCCVNLLGFRPHCHLFSLLFWTTLVCSCFVSQSCCVGVTAWSCVCTHPGDVYNLFFLSFFLSVRLTEDQYNTSLYTKIVIYQMSITVCDCLETLLHNKWVSLTLHLRAHESCSDVVCRWFVGGYVVILQWPYKWI